jgi:hypothetical protein
MALTKVTYSMIDGTNAINVNDYGADDTGATFSDTAFNLAIAQANAQSAFLYIPPGEYKTQSTLTTITGPGILGSTAGSPVIRHYSPNDLFIVYGPFKKVIGIRLLNMTAAGAGTVDGALLKLRNCWYGYFQDIYAAHDLDNYSGICLEQNYDGSLDDAYFLGHGGVWYNTAINLSVLYNVFGSERGFGITLRVNANALGVVNPPGEPAGTYSGSVANNQLIGCNIEGKAQGLRMVECANNIIMGGQWLGNGIQVRVSNGRQNQFLQTKHNQWTTAPFQIDGVNSGKNLINYPTLFSTTPSPWSLGTLTATDEVRHAGEGMVNVQSFASPVSFRNESTVSGLSGNTPTYSWLGDNNDGGNNLLKIRYTGNIMSWDVYDETTGAFVRTALEQGNGVATGRLLRPGADNLYSLGTSAKRWTEVFAANGTINTSDEREKQDFADITEAERQAALGIKALIKSFKFKDAVVKKGNNARIHFGVSAQQVAEVFRTVGLNPDNYSMFCYDEWDANEEQGIVAGNRYGIRYDELLAFVIAAL